jgi:hypothetical protein
MAEISTQKRPLGGFPWVILVYHWGNQTRENQEADQGPQSMKKPPKHFCLSGFLPSMDTPKRQERGSPRRSGTGLAKQMYHNPRGMSSAPDKKSPQRVKAGAADPAEGQP